MTSLLRARPCAFSTQHVLPGIRSRYLSTHILDKHLSKSIQSYISTTRDPYLNLSIEHHILQKADPKSTILILYINRPSIILGRNQNPWLEVNLALLNSSQNGPSTNKRLENVDLVRRRSGGGTVFHDEGNVNWTVICPASAFTRDKHAEMVVRGLRNVGIDRARVNIRHDIVLDQGDRGDNAVDPDDTHATPFQVPEEDRARRPLKVSGSAYKLTRGRALHHGTCLLSSPNLAVIPDYLHSPARGFIEARGVESVSSPVTNIGLDTGSFIEAVKVEFAEMYHAGDTALVVEVGEELRDHEEIHKGYAELLSPEWKFLQTPQFTLTAKGSRQPLLLDAVQPHITARYGEITEVNAASSFGAADLLRSALIGRKIHEIRDWSDVLRATQSSANPQDHEALKTMADWMNRMLPSVQ